MKHHHDIIEDEIRPSLQDIGGWTLQLHQLHQRLAPRFARPEPRRHALLYLQAVLSDIPRKNGWQIAEQAKQARPYGMQRLLSRAVWDEEGVRDDLRIYVWHYLSPPPIVSDRAEPEALFPEAQGYAYALAVPSTEVVCVQTQQGCLLNDVASIAHHVLTAQDWQRLSQSQGTKGERLFDWAILPLLHRGMVDGRHFLVIRRCLDDPDELAYYLVFAPLATPLPTIVQAIGARWHIEEDLQASKDLGLDHYEVRSYVGWYRHITLVMLAYAFLVGICVQDRSHEDPQAWPTAWAPLIPLTTSEVRHLLARLIWPAPSHAPLICWWSWWRRAHQYWAGYYHRRRRQKAG